MAKRADKDGEPWWQSDEADTFQKLPAPAFKHWSWQQDLRGEWHRVCHTPLHDTYKDAAKAVYAEEVAKGNIKPEDTLPPRGHPSAKGPAWGSWR